MRFGMLAALAGAALLSQAEPIGAQSSPPATPTAASSAAARPLQIRVTLQERVGEDEDDAAARGRLYQAVAKECDTAGKAFGKGCAVDSLVIHEVALHPRPMRDEEFQHRPFGFMRPGPMGMGEMREPRGPGDRDDMPRSHQHMDFSEENDRLGDGVTHIAYDGEDQDRHREHQGKRLVAIVSMSVQ